MQTDLCEKSVLLVTGSVLSGPELKAGLMAKGADVAIVRNVSAAMRLLATREFDGAIVDHGLHNEAFDLCMELRERGIPYIYANAPHKLHTEAIRRAEAGRAAEKLAAVMRAKRRALTSIIATQMHPDASRCVSRS